VHTRTITRPGRVVVHTITQAAPARGAGSPQVANAPSASGPSGAQQSHAVKQQFAGNGSRTLGNIRVGSPATPRWTNSGTRFRLLFDGGAQAIDATSHAGQTFVPAGTYSQVTVQADGNWTIRIG